MSAKRFFTTLLFIFLLTLNLTAQESFWQIEQYVSKILLQKDLKQAISDSENSEENLENLRVRLSFYGRAANFEKIALTIRQIITHPNFSKNSYIINENLDSFLKNKFFQDVETLRIYLQNVAFNEEIYRKFAGLCLQNQTSCKVEEFDKWLVQKSQEANDSNNLNDSLKSYWIKIRLDWRRKFGLGTEDITAQLIRDLQTNPSDLKAAQRYIDIFNKPQDLQKLVVIFSSKQSFDYYLLGEYIVSLPNNPQEISREASRERKNIANEFLLKSLEIPFTAKDTERIKEYLASRTAVSPQISNYEKQLRFWTKEQLAENYKNSGEPQKAQPLVEELTKMDKSDISSKSPTYLAGQVQSVSGARVVEKQILQEEKTRRNSAQYWEERINYFHGRNEPEQVFNAYLESFKTVPFDLTDNASKQSRLRRLDWFAGYVESSFSSKENSKNKEEWSEAEKKDYKYWMLAKRFLKEEFEKNRSDTKYSYELVNLIKRNHLDILADEIIGKHPELLVKAASEDLLSLTDNLVWAFLESENISDEKKSNVYGEIMTVAERKDFEKARLIFEATTGNSAKKYAVRFIPLFERKLKESERYLRKYSGDEKRKYELLVERYAKTLFTVYLYDDNQEAAQNLLSDYNLDVSYSLNSLLRNALDNQAFDKAVKIWKLKANINRQDLEGIEFLKKYSVVADALREFYQEMKTNEYYSPIPDIALESLK